MKLHERLFLLLLILLPSQLSYHFWPTWTQVLGRRVDYLSPTLYLTDLLIAALLVSYLSVNPVKIRISRKKFLLVSLFLLFTLVNILGANAKLEAAYQWLKVGEFIALGWYICQAKPKLSLVTIGLTIGVVYSSLIAIAQFILQRSLGGIFWWLGERTFSASTPGIARIDLGPLWGLKLRPYATFPHPNVLGGFLAVTLPLIFLEAKLNHSPSKKIIFLGILILGIGTLILTFSRSAIVIGLVLLALTAIAGAKEKLKIGLLTLIGLIVATSLILSRVNPLEESWFVRQELVGAAFKIWPLSPIFGVGLGNFLVELPKALVSRQVYFLQPIHNIYLEILTETGLIGLGMFLLVALKSLRKFWSKLLKFKLPGGSLVVNPYSLSLAALLVLGLVDHYPITLQQGQLLLVLFLSLSLAS